MQSGDKCKQALLRMAAPLRLAFFATYLVFRLRLNIRLN
jgi:hypothetical protein